MKNRSLNIYIVLFICVVTFFVLRNTFKSSGIEAMKSGFTEEATYRNENNTGPIQRIYLVTVKDTVWSEIETYGQHMPHSKYGNTKVYFFLKDQPYPTKAAPGKVNFDPQFNSYCIGLYEKSAMGNFGFSRKVF